MTDQPIPLQLLIYPKHFNEKIDNLNKISTDSLKIIENIKNSLVDFPNDELKKIAKSIKSMNISYLLFSQRYINEEQFYEYKDLNSLELNGDLYVIEITGFKKPVCKELWNNIKYCTVEFKGSINKKAMLIRKQFLIKIILKSLQKS